MNSLWTRLGVEHEKRKAGGSPRSRFEPRRLNPTNQCAKATAEAEKGLVVHLKHNQSQLCFLLLSLNIMFLAPRHIVLQHDLFSHSSQCTHFTPNAYSLGSRVGSRLERRLAGIPPCCLRHHHCLIRRNRDSAQVLSLFSAVNFSTTDQVCS